MDSLLRAGQTQQGPGQLMVDNHRHFDRFAAATRHHNLPRQIGKPKQQILFSDPIKWMIKSLFFGVNLRLYFRFFNNIIFISWQANIPFVPFTLYAFVFLSFCFQLLWYFVCLKRMEMFNKEDNDHPTIDVCGLPHLWLFLVCVFEFLSCCLDISIAFVVLFCLNVDPTRPKDTINCQGQ